MTPMTASLSMNEPTIKVGYVYSFMIRTLTASARPTETVLASSLIESSLEFTLTSFSMEILSDYSKFESSMELASTSFEIESSLEYTSSLIV